MTAELHDEAAARGRPRVVVGLVVAVLLSLPLLVFFAPTLDGRAPGGFDLIYQSSPWRDQARRPLDAQSPAQVDQAEQLSWVDGIWQSLRSGHLPMWTPAVGGGTSLGTTPVFATYSVFTMLGEAFGGGALGLSVRVLAAVAIAELFTFLFLRRMRLSIGAAIFGTVAYVYSGAVVVFETRNAIPLLLPVALWCTDRLASRVTPRRMVAMALVVVALWFEGFPAMLVHALAICGAYWLVRVAGRLGIDPRRREARREWLREWGRTAAAFGASMTLGFMVCAVSAVPFGLQLGYNDVFAARATEASTLPRVAAWWLIDERALGAPDRGPWFAALNPFEGLAAVGTIVMVLAVVGVIWGAVRRNGEDVRSAEDPSVAGESADADANVAPGRDLIRNFWAVVVAVLVVSTYLGGPILQVLYRVPGIDGNPFWRARFVTNFGLAVLGAIGLHEIERWWTSRRQRDLGETHDELIDGYVLATRRLRIPQVVVAVAVMVCLVAPLVASWGEYVDLARLHGALARSTWRSEGIVLIAALTGGAALLWGAQHLKRPRAVWRTVALGGFVAALAFVQVGLQLTRFTPQVDRSFYYPATQGYRELRAAVDHRYRFLGSGMGTFAPNSAMTHDVIDARSHSFRDPQWKSLILRVFPDALNADPLKINVDFHGNVNWDSPVFDEMAIGVLAMSSSEVPLGDREPTPAAAAWTDLAPSQSFLGAGPTGSFVGVDLRLRTTAACRSGVIVVTATSGTSRAVTRRPISDAHAAGVADVTLPFAMPLGDLAADAESRLRISLDGAPRSCHLRVGTLDAAGARLAFGRFTRPHAADWKMTSADGGWIYTRPSADPLVRVVTHWSPHATAGEALHAALAPTRTAGDPIPVAFAGAPPATHARAAVSSWSSDSDGLSATVTSSGPAVLATAFNAAPGWSVRVDGRSRPLVEPDGAFLGVEVGPGRHEVRFDYRLPGLRVGALMTLLGLFGLVVLWIGAGPWRRLAGRLRQPDAPSDPQPVER